MCVSLFHLLLNNANCDIWYHCFYMSKLLGGGGGGGSTDLGQIYIDPHLKISRIDRIDRILKEI